MPRSPKCDPQREEVYRWERGFKQQFCDHSMPIRSAQRIVREMAKHFGVKRPRLFRSRLGKRGYTGAAWGADIIEVNVDLAEFTAILLAHEMAHVICAHEGLDEPDHGPVWLGTYLYLLDRFKIVPLSATVPSASAAGLKFRDPLECAPGRFPS